MRALPVVAFLLIASPAAAQMDASAPLPSLPPVVRVEPAVPRFLAPNDLDAEDYRVEWDGPPVPDVTLSFEKNSLQWARVDEVLRLPRGRLQVEAKAVQGGTVKVAGFVQTLAREGEGAGEADGSAKMLVPLVSGPGNPIEVAVTRGGVETRGRALIRFAPKKHLTDEQGLPVVGRRVYIDTTCSGFNVRFDAKGGRDDEWMYVGCRNVTAKSTEHRTSSLELVVFWDNVGDKILVDGVETVSQGDNVWTLRASSAPGFVQLQAGSHEVTLRYAVSNWPRKGNLGVGVGPYLDTFEGTGNDVRVTLEPLVTVYGSFALSPFSRLVMFNATPIRADTYSDTGFYLQKRTSEALDRRVVGNVFLGGHFIAFTAVDPFDPEEKKQIFFRFGVPQGVEFMVRDVPRPGYNVVAGGLTNAAIGGTAYYNLWLRWGNPYMFVELNYIAWKELIVNPDDEEDLREVNLRSIGISVGFPLIKFL